MSSSTPIEGSTAVLLLGAWPYHFLKRLRNCSCKSGKRLSILHVPRFLRVSQILSITFLDSHRQSRLLFVDAATRVLTFRYCFVLSPRSSILV